MVRKSLMSLSILALAGLIVSAVVAADVPQQKAKVGISAPAFTLQDQDGKSVSLADFAGKIVVLEWFNDECPIVQRHYKEDAMNKLAAKYTAKGVVWLGIDSSSTHDLAHNKASAGKMSIHHPILSDQPGTIGHAYGATNTPGMYIIDKSGNLAYMGGIDDNAQDNKTQVKNYVSQALDELLAGVKVSEPLTQQYGCTVKYAN